MLGPAGVPARREVVLCSLCVPHPCRGGKWGVQDADAAAAAAHKEPHKSQGVCTATLGEVFRQIVWCEPH